MKRAHIKTRKIDFTMRMYWTWATFHLALVGLLLHPLLSAAYEVVYAVNCGGGKHTDRFGIRYGADDNKVGIASDFGKSLIISRVHPDDVVLYQTERYHTSTFSYSVPIEDDGDYALITKFAEVYFQYPNQKVRVNCCHGYQGYTVIHRW